MEFSLRKKLCIKNYFKKSNKKNSDGKKMKDPENIQFGNIEAASSPIHCVTNFENLNLVTVDKSDTDLLAVTIDTKKNKIKNKRSKKRKLDNENNSDDEKKQVKMSPNIKNELQNTIVPSSLIRELADESKEEKEMKILLNYQKELDKVELSLQNLLKDFGSHIKLSKICSTKSGVLTQNTTKKMMNRLLVFKVEQAAMKIKFKNQLLSMQNSISIFIHQFFQDTNRKTTLNRHINNRKSLLSHCKIKRQLYKHGQIKNKKKDCHYDMPGLREAMLLLFPNSTDDDDSSFSGNNITDFMSECDE